MIKYLTLILLFASTSYGQYLGTGVNLGYSGYQVPKVTVSPEASSLLTDLKAWWKFDATSGNAADSYGSNTLTAGNSPGSTTGIVGNCRTYTIASTQYFQISDNADVSLGDKDWTIGGWVYLTAVATVQTIAAKRDNTTATNNEFTFIYNTSSQKLEFYQFNSGTTANAALSSSTTVTSATWYYVLIWHDNTANKLYMQVNGGTVSEVALTVVPYEGGSSFQFGAQISTHTSLLGGRTDEWGIWHRVLTTAERTYLYNSGAGRTLTANLIL